MAVIGRAFLGPAGPSLWGEDKGRRAGRRPHNPNTPSLRLPTRQEKEVMITSRMFFVWPCLLALGLLVGRGEAQSCTQAYGGPNLARGRPTSQSSTFTNEDRITGMSSYAVDGNCDGQWISRTCTHTKHDFNPWWSVDLGQEYAVSLVVVKNRQSVCCSERLKGATVHVGDHMGDFSKSSITCGTITDLRGGSLSTILCNGAVGRYVTIVIPGREEYLTLCEVEVYGTKPQSSC